ncbi:MAG: hypothetical protein SFZ24_02405 [Planctomycetota bacterium]|nr:hypothetical protein [Planctomycetota bacterium]
MAEPRSTSIPARPAARALAVLPRLAADLRRAALDSALLHADPAEVDVLVGAFLDALDEKPSAPGFACLLSHWDRLTPDAKVAALDCSRRWLPHVLDELTARTPAAAASVAASLVGRPATEGLPDPRLERPLWDAVDRVLAARLSRALEERLPGVLEAVLAVSPVAGPMVRGELSRADQPAAMSLRTAARGAALEIDARAATLMLALPAVAVVARERLAGMLASPGRAEVFRQAALLRTRERSAELRRLPRLDELLLNDDGLMSDAGARMGRLAWARAAAIKPATRLELLGRAVGDSSAAVRLEAARMLADQESGAASDEILMDLSFDADPWVARCAAGAFAGAGSPGRRRALGPVMARLTRSPHACVRALALAAAGRDDPMRLLAAGRGLDAARRLRIDAARDARPGIALVERAVRAGGVAALAALDAAERLGWCGRVAPALLDAAMGRDERVVSRAVLLLRHVREADADRLVERSVEHESPRVRANAVEALLERGPIGRWETWRDDAVARARANAVRRGGSGEALETMLHDARPGHRLSALWAAERSRAVELAEVVDRLVLDEDARVAERAARCGASLRAAHRARVAGSGLADFQVIPRFSGNPLFEEARP